MYYFKMEADTTLWGNGYGQAFKANNGKEDTPLWRVEGWYSYNVYLSNDGRHLTSMDGFPEHLSSINDTILSFYKDGALLKSYTTLDLVVDTSKIRYTVSHFLYATDTEFTSYNNQFMIKSVDNIIHIFDIKTGEIISSKKEFWLKTLLWKKRVELFSLFLFLSTFLFVFNKNLKKRYHRINQGER